MVKPEIFRKRFSWGLFIGRFQPVHLGHLKYISRILEECDRLVILIGSSQESGTSKNPLDIRKRKKLLRESLIEFGIRQRKVKIRQIMDYPEDERWLAEVLKAAGPFEVYFAGENKVTAKIFRDKGFVVKTSTRIDRLSGTKVRRFIERKKDIRDLVTSSVYAAMQRR